jgi:hypothetical protein
VVAVQVFDGLVDNRNRRTTIKRPDVQDAVANAALLHRFVAGVLGIGDQLFEVPDIEGVLDPLVIAVLPGRLLVIALPVRAVLEFVSGGRRGRFCTAADGDSRGQGSGIPVDELGVAAGAVIPRDVAVSVVAQRIGIGANGYGVDPIAVGEVRRTESDN